MNATRCKTTLATISLGLLAPWAAGAAEIERPLEEAMQGGHDVAFIARFADRVDLDALPGRGRGGGTQLAALLWALRHQAEVSQQGAVALLRKAGAKRIIELWSINALASTASPEAVRDLAALPEVERISLDATLAAPGPEPATATSAVEAWNLDMVLARELWAQGYTGAGTVVATMDTGADASHPDLAERWRGGSNSWYDPNGEHATPHDLISGHGTAVLGVVLGGDASGTPIGVAPGAEWIAVKMFNDAGIATYSGIHQGFQWLLDPDGDPSSDDGPDVVNNSWGFSDQVGRCILEFEPDLEVLKTAGIAVVFSAGNQGADGTVSPANNPQAFAVGAVDSLEVPGPFSSQGPSDCDGSTYPEVVAPGVNVYTTDLGGQYRTGSGTSLAAPHVAGVMALLRDKYPGASVAELELALKESASDVSPAGADNVSGYGLVDAVAAKDWLAIAPPCVDYDGDGFYLNASCGAPADCNDYNPGINPAACDIKGDGIDQDCDGVDRLKGKSCPDSGGGTGGGGSGGGGGKGKKK